MVLNIAVLGLLTCSGMVLVVALLAAVVGGTVLVGWDPMASGREQLARERRTYLVQATVRVALACQLLSLFLFLATVDRVHPLITGAMCAAGTLAAGPLGYPTLLLKLDTFLLCGLWLVVDRASPVATSRGVVRFKHLFLIVIAAGLLVENVVQYRYFADLEPDIITSCCGTTFDAGASGLAADLATLPVRQTRLAYLGLLAVTSLFGVRSLVRRRSVAPYALLSVALGVVAIASVITWIAPAYYELPTHHCPFCLLAPDYGRVGFALYAALFAGVATGGGAGLTGLLRRLDPLGSIKAGAESGLCAASLVGFALFSLLAAWPLAASGIRLEGY